MKEKEVGLGTKEGTRGEEPRGGLYKAPRGRGGRLAGEREPCGGGLRAKPFVLLPLPSFTSYRAAVACKQL